MKKKIFINTLSIIMMVLLSVNFTACSSDDDGDSGNGLTGYYLNMNYLPSQSDWAKINNAIEADEVLSSYGSGKKKHDYVASYSLFIDSNGMYHDTDAYFGRLRFTISSFINVVKIVDDNTLAFYIGTLYVEGKGSGEALYKLYAGNIFGNMAYYGTPTYYTYVKYGNKIVTSDGDIYTIVDGGLMPEESSTVWKKYNPKHRTHVSDSYD